MPPKQGPPPVSYSGNCLCGRLKWTTIQAQDTVQVGMCYCDDCQRSTGAERSAFLVIEKRSFKVQGPTATYHSWGTQTQNPKNPRSDRFTKKYVGCSECHSPLLWENSWSAGRVHVFIGTLVPDEKKKLDDKVNFVTYSGNKLAITKVGDDFNKVLSAGGNSYAKDQPNRPERV